MCSGWIELKVSIEGFGLAVGFTFVTISHFHVIHFVDNYPRVQLSTFFRIFLLPNINRRMISITCVFTSNNKYFLKNI